MTQFTKKLLSLVSLFALSTSLKAQSILFQPAVQGVEVFKVSAIGFNSTGNLAFAFALKNTSSKSTEIIISGKEIKLYDETNEQYSPYRIRIDNKNYKPQDLMKINLMPGASTLCQFVFKEYNKSSSFIYRFNAKAGITVSTSHETHPELAIYNTDIRWN